MAKNYDVWILASNTVYKKVPFEVVTDWAQQGRLGAQDKLRVAGNEAWVLVREDAMIADFLFVKKPAPATPPVAMTALPSGASEFAWARSYSDDDDDPDMIPLIDISLVLLIFFMMTSAVSSLSPVDVPQMRNQFDTSAPTDAFVVVIEKRPNGDPRYALRVGEKPADAADDELDTLAALLARLDERFKGAANAPEVRIACHRELPSERVHDLVKELEKRRKDGKISGYRAEVNEKR